MMRSLWSGVSGLKIHQTKMDVIGNNIANVNTVGFRSSSVNFTDVFYQTTQSAAGPNPATGAAGTNAVQIGLGANVASINVNLSGTGATNRTDRGMDLMINGDAFFVVNSNGRTLFTKSGCFDIDANGTLYCTTNGATVLGWRVDENGEIRKDTATSLQLMTPETQSAEPEATSNVTLAGNIDSKDKDVQYSVDGNGYPIAVSFYDQVGNLFTAKLKVMKVNPDGLDEKKADCTFTVDITDITDANGSILKKSRIDETTGNIVYETTNQYINFGGTARTYTVDPNDGTITFADSTLPQLLFNGSTGDFVSVGANGAGGGAGGGTGDDEDTFKSLNLTLNNNQADNAFPLGGVDIDFSKLTKYASGGSDGKCSVDPKRGDVEGVGAGNSAGQMNGFTVNPDGKVYAVYDNGDNRLLGQIVVATFPNPSGLEAVGDSMFAATLNSGDFDGIGIDITEVGSLSVGALEMSNVDLATEFTNMITTQRGFQANSRTITTSDTMLEELINLKR